MALCEVLLIAPRPAAVVEQSRLRLRVLIYHNDVEKRRDGEQDAVIDGWTTGS